MLLFPKKPKFFKSFSNKNLTNNSKKFRNILKFSKICLIADQAGFISNFQIEAIKTMLKRLLKKKAKIFFRLFPSQSITKKPNEVRLGRGKGNMTYWAYYAKKNKILIEVSGPNTKLITLMLNVIKYKLNIKSYIYNQKFRWTF